MAEQTGNSKDCSNVKGEKNQICMCESEILVSNTQFTGKSSSVNLSKLGEMVSDDLCHISCLVSAF